MALKEEITELYRKTATELPKDVFSALEMAKESEDGGGKEILSKILENSNMAKTSSKPICQDTGIPIFYVKRPADKSEKELREIIGEATIAATEEIPLRPNAVDSLTDKNLGNKPIIHFKESDKLEIGLILKGGGSENVSAIYKLPDSNLNAGRNLDGVRRVVLDTVFRAQGKGCPPYFVGVAIAGSMEEAMHLSKKQLLRNLDDVNSNPELKNFEENVLGEINELGIGPLGLGGKATALGVKAATAPRHPASFFVGISIGCWCMRRQSL
ncbi:MAG: fumarate hydratase [Candidatus Diapherotrites archaeon]